MPTSTNTAAQRMQARIDETQRETDAEQPERVEEVVSHRRLVHLQAIGDSCAFNACAPKAPNIVARASRRPAMASVRPLLTSESRATA